MRRPKPGFTLSTLIHMKVTAYSPKVVDSVYLKDYLAGFIFFFNISMISLVASFSSTSLIVFLNACHRYTGLYEELTLFKYSIYFVIEVFLPVSGECPLIVEINFLIKRLKFKSMDPLVRGLVRVR